MEMGARVCGTCASSPARTRRRKKRCVRSMVMGFIATHPLPSIPSPSNTQKSIQLRALLATEAGATSVPWCPPQESHRLLQLPAAFRLVQFGPYQAGLLYGMDAASAAAVWALGPQPGEHVLDLCCAPGLKLCAVADALTGLGSVTGVDVSRTRLAVARKVAVKYGVGRPNDDALAASGGGTMTCRLLCADGQSFGLGPLEEWDAGEEEGVVFDSRAYDWRVRKVKGGRDGGLSHGCRCAFARAYVRALDSHLQGMEARGQRRMNRGTRKKELLALRAVLKPQGEGRENVSSSSTLSSSELQQTKDERESCALYDRVLVDADCTHDGSARHLSKVAALDASMCVHTAASSDVAVPPSISPQLGDIHW